MDKQTDRNHVQEDSLSDKLIRECGLLASLGETLPNAIATATENAITHPEHTLITVGCSAIAGLAFAALTRNPAMAGKAMEPLINIGLKAAPLIGGVAVAADLGQRLNDPIMTSWNSPLNLDANKENLAKNLGIATVDYTLMGIGGLAGAKLGPQSFDTIGKLLTPPLASQKLALACESPGLTGGKIESSILTSLGKNAEENELVLMMKGSHSDGFPRRVSLSGTVHVESVKPGVTPKEGDVWVQPHTSNKFICARSFSKGEWRPLELLELLNMKDTKYMEGERESMMRSLARKLEKMKHVELVLVERPASKAGGKAFDQFKSEYPIVPELKITGKVTSGTTELRPPNPAKGDTHVSTKPLDKDRTKLRVPGIIFAEIYDGNCWKRIDVPRFTGEKGWYGRADSKGEVGEKARWLKIKLEQSRDRTVNWGEGRHKYGYQ